MGATVATVAYLGLEARAVEVQVQLSSGLPRFHHRRPARQGRRRKPRAGPRGAGGDRPGAAAQAHHGQPVARRPAQGRLAFRSADRACACWRRSARPTPRPVALCRGRRAQPRRADRRLAGRAAGRAPCLGGRQGADLPGVAGQRGGLGGRARSDRRARPAGAARASEGHARCCRAPPEARPSRSVAGPDLAQVKGQEVAKRALEIAAAGGHNLLMSGPPGRGQVAARRLPAGHPAAARAVRGARSVDGRLGRRRARAAADPPPPAVPRAAPQRVDAGAGRRRAARSARARSASRISACCSSTSFPNSSARCSIRCASRSRPAASASRAPTPTSPSRRGSS